MDYVVSYLSPIGELTVASDGVHITGLWMENQRYYASSLSAQQMPGDDLPVMTEARSWLDMYFSGKQPDICSIPLKPRGTPFQQLIWQLLTEIPYGSTASYGAIAKLAAQRLGRSSMSSQAVGNAVGRNPISILIPCHRVIGADGSLTGYAGGLQKKQWLLTMETSTKKC